MRMNKNESMEDGRARPFAERSSALALSVPAASRCEVLAPGFKLEEDFQTRHSSVSSVVKGFAGSEEVSKSHQHRLRLQPHSPSFIHPRLNLILQPHNIRSRSPAKIHNGQRMLTRDPRLPTNISLAES